jgi:hypothetical protein
MNTIEANDFPVPAGPRMSVLEPGAAAKQLVELSDTTGLFATLEIGAILRGYESRKYIQAAGGDGGVVISAAELNPAVFDHSYAPALRAVGGRQLFQPDYAVSDAVNGLVGDLGRQVVQQQHGAVEFREVMLDRENLPPIAQRALGQQPDLGETVEHYAVRPHSIHGSEDLPGGFAQFKVGRIEQALLLLGIKQALGRQ